MHAYLGLMLVYPCLGAGWVPHKGHVWLEHESLSKQAMVDSSIDIIQQDIMASPDDQPRPIYPCLIYGFTHATGIIVESPTVHLQS